MHGGAKPDLSKGAVRNQVNVFLVSKKEDIQKRRQGAMRMACSTSKQKTRGTEVAGRPAKTRSAATGGNTPGVVDRKSKKRERRARATGKIT